MVHTLNTKMSFQRPSKNASDFLYLNASKICTKYIGLDFSSALICAPFKLSVFRIFCQVIWSTRPTYFLIQDITPLHGLKMYNSLPPTGDDLN